MDEKEIIALQQRIIELQDKVMELTKTKDVLSAGLSLARSYLTIIQRKMKVGTVSSQKDARRWLKSAIDLLSRTLKE